ncbi:glycosyltransferase family 2 protein [Candidatus Daviesbacteria bacterium]|nr:glycosyltransferase family 2 protein [Candidatus Daviesbacteria bacterium]
MLSVVIITKNEQELIKACLESVSFADEIIVFDNGSTDKTLDIAKQYTKKVFRTEVSDFALIRNNAFQETKGDWVLYVDADERVSADLKKEILELIEKDNGNTYAISRINIVFGSIQKYGPFWPDWVIRLVKKENFKEWFGEVHEYLRFEGKLGYTKNSFIHLTHRDVDQVVLKSLEWSKIDAKLRLKANHPTMSGWRFLRIFITEAFNQGFLRKGFFSGTIGVMDSLMQIFSMVLTYIRLWQLQQKEPLTETYKKIDQRLIDNEFHL